jgi:hypothetical protein
MTVWSGLVFRFARFDTVDMYAPDHWQLESLDCYSLETTESSAVPGFTYHPQASASANALAPRLRRLPCPVPSCEMLAMPDRGMWFGRFRRVQTISHHV